MTKLSFDLSHYWKPTPKKIRKMADAFRALTITAAAWNVLADNRIAVIVILALGEGVKFLSDCFYDNNGNNDNTATTEDTANN